MKKRILAAILGLCMLALSLTGCGNAPDVESGAAAQDYPVQVDGVTIESQPEGVAVLSPNIADIILALGYEIHLKARSAECTQPDLEVLPEVTMDDAAQMQELGVTLLFADEDPDEATAADLSSHGISVITLEPAGTRSEFSELYSQVGSALAGGSTGYGEGQETAQNIFTTLDDITRIIPNSDIPSTAVYITDTQGSVATGDTFIDVLLSSAGFINGVKSETGGKVEVSTLVSANPTYIFCPTGLAEQLSSTEGFQDMSAVQEGRVCEIEPELMEWQGRSIISAVSQMAGFAHPELAGSSSESSASSESSTSSESSQSSESSTSSESSESSASSESSTSSESSASSAVSVDPNTQLQRGDSGDAVLQMQERLDELGYMFTLYDGEFDSGTEQAVKDFQLNNGFYTTGIANAELLTVLYSDEAQPAG